MFIVYHYHFKLVERINITFSVFIRERYNKVNQLGKAQNGERNMKAVFHIDELNKWNETSKNVANLLNEAPDTDIVVSVNGNAIKGYLEDENSDFIQLEEVAFHACNNAMKANNVSEESLSQNVEVVPAGVLDLVELQHAGYAYIKA